MNLMSGYSSVGALLGENGAGEEDEPDWVSLHREGLLGLAVDHAIRNQREVPDKLRHTFMQAVAFEMRCGSVLSEISQAASGIQTLTFKGCALAFGLYPRAGQRAFGDIDVAVPTRDWPGMVEVLKSLGFAQSVECLFNRDGLVVDLHRHPLHQLADLVGPRALEWWEGLQPLSARTGTAVRLAHEHEFVLALFHGSKHSFSRAGWVVDLALLAQHVDSDRLARAVHRYRAHRQLAYASECLDRWFGLLMPQALSRLASRRWNPVERRFVQLVLQRKAPDFLGMLTPVASAPHPWAALVYLLKTLYPPGTPFLQRSQQLLSMMQTIWKS